MRPDASALVAGLVTTAALALAGCQGNVFDLAVGTCFDDPGSGEITDVPVVDCDEPHDNEVYATFELAGGEFPGTGAVDEQADAGCRERFPGWAGIEYAQSRLVASYLAPSETSWDEADDREVVCFVYDLDGEPLTGSMEGRGV